MVTKLRGFALARAVLVGILGHRDGIDPAEPAMQINIGAASAAERPELVRRRLATDGTGRCARRVAMGHCMHIGRQKFTCMRWACPPRSACFCKRKVEAYRARTLPSSEACLALAFPRCAAHQTVLSQPKRMG